MSNPVKAKLEKMNKIEVFDVLLGLKDRFDDAAMMVFEVALEVLEAKMPEDEYLRVIEQL